MVLNILTKLLERYAIRVILTVLARIPDFTVVIDCLVLVVLWRAFYRHLRLGSASGHLALLFEMLDLLMQVLCHKLEKLAV